MQQRLKAAKDLVSAEIAEKRRQLALAQGASKVDKEDCLLDCSYVSSFGFWAAFINLFIYLFLKKNRWYDVPCHIEKFALGVFYDLAVGAIKLLKEGLNLQQFLANAFFDILSGIVGIAEGALKIVKAALNVVKYLDNP